jgi:hypothetical protein
MSKDKKVYQFKVSLNDVKPPVWRRFLIPADASFWALHVAIQDCFGWIGYHLHRFYIGPAWDTNSILISMPNPVHGAFALEDDCSEGELDEVETKIEQLISREQKTANYIYDFGDNWIHKIQLEQIHPFDKNANYPQLIKGKRACPWEDSGGPRGYQYKLEILRDKDHEYHQEILDWVGVDSYEDLDLENFDPKSIEFSDPAEELKLYRELLL